MYKARKIRSDSTSALIAAAQRQRTYDVPDFISLRPVDYPYWRATVACRDDWRPDELILVGHLVRALADIERLHLDIDGEGVVIDGKPNPKCAIEETLSRRALALTRHLQIHARATRGESRDAAKQAKAPVFDFDDDLIARL